MDDREYYRAVYGFDPETDRIPLGKSGSEYRYEQRFQLVSDPILDRAGVFIYARVNITEEGIQNRIVFARDGQEAAVHCVHTAITSITTSALRRLDEKHIVELAKSTEFNPIELRPEEHFASLKSYVAGVAELGIANLMRLSYYSEDIDASSLPFGFNTLMQKQVVSALHEVSPGAAERVFSDLILELAEYTPAKWFDKQLAPLDDFEGHWWNFNKLFKRYGFFVYLYKIFFPNVQMFEELVTNAASWRLKKLAARFGGTDPLILEQLALDPDLGVRNWVANHSKTSKKAHELLHDADRALVDEPYLQFNGERLIRKEAEILAGLETKTGKVIPPESKVDAHTRGFVAKNSRVIELGLYATQPGQSISDLKTFDKLEVLNLRWNRFRQVPRVIFSLGGLKTLILAKNKLRELPEIIEKLSNLERLYLERNALNTLPSTLSKLKNLREITLDRNQFSELPHVLVKLPQLEILSVERNEIRDVESWIGQLVGLKRLSLRGNALSKLPEETGTLKRMIELNLSENQLSTLPDSVRELRVIKKLDLSLNQFTQLPLALFSLISLTHLDVSSNFIEEFSLELGSLQNLRVLSAETNKLRELPASIGNCRSLRELFFQNNQLTTLPPTLGKLIQLRRLNLAGNQLTYLPDSLVDLVALREIDLTDNQIHNIPEWFESLANLTTILFAGNNIESIPSWIGSFWNLTKLDLSRNKIREIPGTLLKLLRLSSCLLFPGNRIKKNQSNQNIVDALKKRGIMVDAEKK